MRRQVAWNGIACGLMATIYRFRLCNESAQLLKAVDSLYAWQHPEFPEDLCLLRPDGTPWLVTIAHEKDAFLELTAVERLKILSELPGILTSREK